MRIARASCRFETRFSLVQHITRLPVGAYYTYPHANGFLSNVNCILARPGPEGNVCYLQADLTTGSVRRIAVVGGARTYYAVSQAGVMAVPLDGGISAVDLMDGRTRTVATLPGWRVLSDCDIDATGTKVLVIRHTLGGPVRYRIDQIELASGRIEPVVEACHPLDHAHFSPFDPAWVCFADGTPHAQRRTWLWHAVHAPQGRQVFQQVLPNGRHFDLGHERAMFNKPALLTIAFADSTAAPRGLYEVGFDGQVQVVSPSNSDSHCNVSRDGRWAVVSSLSPVADEPASVDFCRSAPSDWTDSSIGYVESDVTAVCIATGYRQLLVRGTNAVRDGQSVQPFEAQPSISPDGRWVLVKDARTQRVMALRINQTELEAFLRFDPSS